MAIKHLHWNCSLEGDVYTGPYLRGCTRDSHHRSEMERCTLAFSPSPVPAGRSPKFSGALATSPPGEAQRCSMPPVPESYGLAQHLFSRADRLLGGGHSGYIVAAWVVPGLSQSSLSFHPQQTNCPGGETLCWSMVPWATEVAMEPLSALPIGQTALSACW